MSAEIASFLFSSAEKLHAGKTLNHTFQGLISISPNQN